MKPRARLIRKADAVAHFRTQRALAEALGITEAAVSDWGEWVPEGRAYQLEVVTNGVLSAQGTSSNSSALGAET